MDVILYCSLQTSTLVDPKRQGVYSPFHPLSVKLLMSDPVQHYIINPLSEYFDDFTHFSKVFYFITPNMISFFHLFLAVVSAKFVSSDSLRTRRLGVVIYQIRSWLDSLDGVVFRSQHNEKNTYVSHHESWGYLVDAMCDITGGVLVSFGVLFYLFKQPTSFFSKYKDDSSASLPLTKSENGFVSSEKHSSKPSKKMLFWKCWCWGFQIFWRLVLGIKGWSSTSLQTTALHSTSTWVIFYIWRYIDGQALIQIYLIAIFVDKVWVSTRIQMN
ncbi:hypothetical protein FSP39_009353 [Pinctada imbricata]|uniref:Uncharacterized protein n=1 Tax=Pinctada imbricata TaxID=66713 RepID=A0AA89BX60_PINIB|nr:hypothetical protein FSP39_009353 [Pinctada imbricata]